MTSPILFSLKRKTFWTSIIILKLVDLKGKKKRSQRKIHEYIHIVPKEKKGTLHILVYFQFCVQIREV
jgi:hypothetical protein